MCGSLRAGLARPRPSDMVTLATADAEDASAAARSCMPAAPSQASAGTLMRARRVSVSSAVQSQHARRAARHRWNAVMPSSDAGAAQVSCRRSAGTRAKQADRSHRTSFLAKFARPQVRYGHVRMTMQGAGVVRMGNPLSGMFPQLPYLAPGSIPASTDGRGAARAPPIKVMVNPSKVWGK